MPLILDDDTDDARELRSRLVLARAEARELRDELASTREQLAIARAWRLDPGRCARCPWPTFASEATQ